MRRDALILLLTLVTSIVGYAQQTAPPKYGTLTGKDWKQLPEEARTYLAAGYLWGYIHGKEDSLCPFLPGVSASDWEACNLRVPKEPNLTIGEWIAGLNHFYANPYNELVDFEMAWDWVKAKANGVSSEDLERMEKADQNFSKTVHEIEESPKAK